MEQHSLHDYRRVYVLVYLLFAYVEVLSFYLTGYDNNGKFPVRYSLVKKVLMFAFYTTLGLFLFLYFAMLWFVRVWVLFKLFFSQGEVPVSDLWLSFSF